ncbi:hypothetical protein AgCh_040197 [Apium graveolens]
MSNQIKFSSVDFEGSGGGGLSPGKLRSMLMGVEKLRRPQEDEEMDSSFDLRSQDFEIHDNDTATLTRDNLRRLFLYINKFPVIVPDHLWQALKDVVKLSKILKVLRCQNKALEDLNWFSSVDFQGSGGGGLSPGKLRSMLMGVEKLRKQERPQEDEEMDSSFDLRSQDFEIHDNAIVPSGAWNIKPRSTTKIHVMCKRIS